LRASSETSAPARRASRIGLLGDPSFMIRRSSL
jgi:hypothetical protein